LLAFERAWPWTFLVASGHSSTEVTNCDTCTCYYKTSVVRRGASLMHLAGSLLQLHHS
jgi:hypothetical protein